MDYKDYKIEIGGDDQIHCSELNISQNTVAEVKKAIDAHIKKINSAAKEPAFLLSWRWDEIEPVTAGEWDMGYGRSKYRWVVNSEGKRSKESAELIFRDTPEIRAMIDEYKKLVEAEGAARQARQEYLKIIPSMADDAQP